MHRFCQGFRGDAATPRNHFEDLSQLTRFATVFDTFAFFPLLGLLHFIPGALYISMSSMACLDATPWCVCLQKDRILWKLFHHFQVLGRFQGASINSNEEPKFYETFCIFKVSIKTMHHPWTARQTGSSFGQNL
eukprot:Skav230618  [mRNA]  locus=scaffold1673:62203:62604:- [translate_table: standard]